MLGCLGLADGDIGLDAKGRATLEASSEKESDRICTMEVELDFS